MIKYSEIDGIKINLDENSNEIIFGYGSKFNYCNYHDEWDFPMHKEEIFDDFTEYMNLLWNIYYNENIYPNISLIYDANTKSYEINVVIDKYGNFDKIPEKISLKEYYSTVNKYPVFNIPTKINSLEEFYDILVGIVTNYSYIMNELKISKGLKLRNMIDEFDKPL